MGIKDDLSDAARRLFKDEEDEDEDGLFTDQNGYEYQDKTDEEESVDHMWTRPADSDAVQGSAGNVVTATETDDGYSVGAGNAAELFSTEIADGLSEAEMGAAVGSITETFDADGVMDEGWITLDSIDSVAETANSALSDVDGEDGAEDPETEAPGDGPQGTAQTELGASVSNLVGEGPDTEDTEDTEDASDGSEGSEGSDTSDGSEVPDTSDGSEGSDTEDTEDNTDAEAAESGEGGAESGEGTEAPDGDSGGSGGGGAGEDNPWVPYTGAAGGEGWQNSVTGEIRYQEDRPAPTEAEQEAMAEQEGQIPEGEESGLSVGAPVTVDTPDGSVEGEITEQVDEHTVMVETPDGEEYGIPIEEAEYDADAAASQEPESGWADGWDAPPDNWNSIDVGDHVEVWDKETGEAKLGQVEGKQGAGILEVTTDDGEEYILVDDPNNPEELRGALGAVEETLAGKPMSDEEFADLEYSDTVMFDSPSEGWMETEVSTVTPKGTFVEDWDGSDVQVDADDVMFKPPEWQDYPFEDTAELARWDGEYVKYNHPSRGVVSGPLTVQEDDDGDLWFHVDGDDNGDGENCSGFTTKQGHPLEGSTEVVSVDDPFTPWHPMETDTTIPGDVVQHNGETYVVDQVDHQDGLIVTEEGEVFGVDYDDADAIDGSVPDAVWNQDLPEEPPVPGDALWWDDAPEDAAEYQPGDTVYWLDDDGEVQQAAVEGVDDTGKSPLLHVEGDELVGANQALGYADTGAEPGLSDDELSAISVGDKVEYQHGDTEYSAVVQDTFGDGTFTVSGIDGLSGTYTVDPEKPDMRVFGHDPDYDPYDDLEYDGSNMSGEEVADAIVNEVGYDMSNPQGSKDHYLSKGAARWWRELFKAQQEDLKQTFTKFYPETDVNEFWGAFEQWKASSQPNSDYKYEGPHDNPNQRASSAFAHAMDVESPVRGTDPGDDIPYAEEDLGNWVEMADAVSSLSQEFFVQEFLDGNEDGVATISRGDHAVGFRSFVNRWLDDPSADSYAVEGSAYMNYDGGASSQSNTWNDWAYEADVEAGHVGVMTDYMFNPGGVHSNEEELWITSDGLTMRPGSIHISDTANKNSYNGETPFGTSIESMSRAETEAVATWIDGNWNQLRGADKFGIEHDPDWSEEQVKTLNRVADQLESHGVYGYDDFKDRVRNLAGEFGIGQADWKTDADTDTTAVAVEDPTSVDDLAFDVGDTVVLPNGQETTVTGIDEADLGMPYKTEDGGWVAQSNLLDPSGGADDETVDFDAMDQGQWVTLEDSDYGYTYTAQYTGMTGTNDGPKHTFETGTGSTFFPESNQSVDVTAADAVYHPDVGIETGDTIEYDDGAGAASGTVTDVDDSGLRVDGPDGDQLVDWHQITEYTPEAYSAEEFHDAGFAAGEEATLDLGGAAGTAEVEVVSPAQGGGPVEVEDPAGNIYLVWEHGEVETV